MISLQQLPGLFQNSLSIGAEVSNDDVARQHVLA